MNYQLRTIATSLLLGLFFLACGEEEHASLKDSASADSSSHEGTSGSTKAVEVDDVPDDPAVRARFEKSLYDEFTTLVGQVPKRQADSLLRVASSNPKTLKETLEKGMAELEAQQKAIARSRLARKYNMPADSIKAIITRVGAVGKDEGKSGE